MHSCRLGMTTIAAGGLSRSNNAIAVDSTMQSCRLAIGFRNPYNYLDICYGSWSGPVLFCKGHTYRQAKASLFSILKRPSYLSLSSYRQRDHLHLTIAAPISNFW